MTSFPKDADTIEAFESAFADRVGARFAIALANGTATLHTGLVALGLEPGARVALPPLTMSATCYAVLLAGYSPVFCDVDPKTWLMQSFPLAPLDYAVAAALPVSLYGLHQPFVEMKNDIGVPIIDDAAQTLRPHAGCSFTSYSFQSSKIISTGEGGMLVTNDEVLAQRAREFSSLGYRMAPTQARIDPDTIKRPWAIRHQAEWPIAVNYRMAAPCASEGWMQLRQIDRLLEKRREAAGHYAAAIAGHEDWIVPQHVPRGTTHDMWTYAVAVASPALATLLQDAVVGAGGEMPYGAWRLTYREPAFADLAPLGTCPVAETLQPRILQFQTNDIRSAHTNAVALRKAIETVLRQTGDSITTVSGGTQVTV